MNSKKKFFIVLVLLIALPFVNYYVITWKTGKSIFNNIADLPEFTNVLVFGSGMNYPSDNPNMSFNSRMDAAEKAAKRQLTERIILTGAVNEKENEAVEMHKELIRRGVDPEMIITDTLGINTYQSILNYKTHYGKEGVIMISSRSHLERALYYSQEERIPGCGYSTVFSQNHLIREVVARLKATFEILR